MQFRALTLSLALAAGLPCSAAEPAASIPLDAFVHRDQYSLSLIHI